MPATLITGMSATGKSSTIDYLVDLGYHAVDLDTAEWSHLVPDDSEYADPGMDGPLDWRWRDDRVHTLLTTCAEMLFVAGTSIHQSRFYPLLDHVIVLAIPTDAAKQRLATRTTNGYGKDPVELERELHLRSVVGPRLREAACLEIDTSAHSMTEVARLITDHARQAGVRTGTIDHRPTRVRGR